MKILQYLNLLDSEGRLSITNLSVIVVLIKLAIISNPSIAETGALFATLLSYAHKRHVNANSTEETEASTTEAINKTLSELEARVSSLDVKVGLK